MPAILPRPQCVTVDYARTQNGDFESKEAICLPLVWVGWEHMRSHNLFSSALDARAHTYRGIQDQAKLSIHISASRSLFPPFYPCAYIIQYYVYKPNISPFIPSACFSLYGWSTASRSLFPPLYLSAYIIQYHENNTTCTNTLYPLSCRQRVSRYMGEILRKRNTAITPVLPRQQRIIGKYSTHYNIYQWLCSHHCDDFNKFNHGPVFIRIDTESLNQTLYSIKSNYKQLIVA